MDSNLAADIENFDPEAWARHLDNAPTARARLRHLKTAQAFLAAVQEREEHRRRELQDAVDQAGAAERQRDFMAVMAIAEAAAFTRGPNAYQVEQLQELHDHVSGQCQGLQQQLDQAQDRGGLGR
jgi:hypothetical protein